MHNTLQRKKVDAFCGLYKFIFLLYKFVVFCIFIQISLLAVSPLLTLPLREGRE